ncbi:hypothetical protein LUZ61_010679 [Rhynchospora tenuis]|uniref:KIB1-4 beta-propeller domain-containing protein n=1 Tax=Rhynchospora tenuis TaxID=198213 RepID=A0AAD6EZK7_9POAL|nr:hypothetical protein LUZ61_010679 [Rhynchospora tenuis]
MPVVQPTSRCIHLISTKLPDLSDRVRVRAVCKTWRSSVSVSDPSPRLPWFLSERVNLDGEILYYSLSSKKTYKIHCQKQKLANFLGTAGSFIFCCQDGYPESVALLNPLNGLEISLPAPKDFEVLGVVSNPLQDDIVAVSGSETCTYCIWMAFMRPGEEDWEILSWNTHYKRGVCLYHEGLSYINEYGEDTLIEDAMTEDLVASIPSPKSRHLLSQHLLEVCGDILLIFKNNATDRLEDFGFDIYQLEEASGNYQWVKIRSIGNQVLFLNYIGGFSVRDSELPGFKGNCIYFENYDSMSNRVLCRHDLENGTTEALPNFWGGRGTWFIPNLG